jgi:putative transposase
MDFMSDSLYDRRRFRVLTLVDTMSRESPLIAVERSFSGEMVARLLEQVAQRIELPEAIQVDNGPEFTSKALDEGWRATRSN